MHPLAMLRIASLIAPNLLAATLAASVLTASETPARASTCDVLAQSADSVRGDLLQMEIERPITFQWICQNLKQASNRSSTFERAAGQVAGSLILCSIVNTAEDCSDVLMGFVDAAMRASTIDQRARENGCVIRPIKEPC